MLLPNIRSTLISVGANFRRLGTAVNELRKELGDNNIGVIKNQHLSPLNGNSAHDALIKEHHRAKHCAHLLFDEGHKPGAKAVSELRNLLEANEFTGVAPSHGSSHETFTFRDTDLVVNMPKSTAKKTDIKNLFNMLGALISAQLREDSTRELHLPRTIARSKQRVKIAA